MITKQLKRIYKAHFGPKRYRYLVDVIRERRCRRLLEIGVWDGEHALQMIRAAQAAGSAVDYIGFDLFEMLDEQMNTLEISKKPPRIAEVKAMLDNTGAAIRLVQGNTRETLGPAVRELGVVDLVFIDGGHSLETVASDWQSVQPALGPKTVVLFDDYWNRTDGGCKPLVDGLDRARYDVQVLPIVDTFRKPDGLLFIQMVRVQRRAPSAS